MEMRAAVLRKMAVPKIRIFQWDIEIGSVRIQESFQCQPRTYNRSIDRRYLRRLTYAAPYTFICTWVDRLNFTSVECKRFWRGTPTRQAIQLGEIISVTTASSNK
jgi:hypothetical protein